MSAAKGVGLLAPDRKFPAATYRDYDTVMGLYGNFPGGGFAGDENCRPGYTDPRQGFETCGIVEFMHSHQLLARMTGLEPFGTGRPGRRSTAGRDRAPRGPRWRPYVCRSHSGNPNTESPT